MKKPYEYEIKKWLSNNKIVGLIVHWEQTGTDTAESFWELITDNNTHKKFKDDDIRELVDIKPSFDRVLRLQDEYIIEVDIYQGYLEENRKELAEYERLKAKFN